MRDLILDNATGADRSQSDQSGHFGVCIGPCASPLSDAIDGWGGDEGGDNNGYAMWLRHRGSKRRCAVSEIHLNLPQLSQNGEMAQGKVLNIHGIE